MSRGRDLAVEPPSAARDAGRESSGVSSRDRAGLDARTQTPSTRSVDGLRQPARRHPVAKTLDERQSKALQDVGRFRTVAVSDLRLRESEVRQLEQKGLLQRVKVPGKDESSQVAVLTRQGQKLARAEVPGAGQEVYAGLAQRRQLAHDAGIYRMYQKEASKIRRQGGKIQRVVLDYELKKRVFSDLNRDPGRASRDRQSEVAQRHHLKVVNGQIPLPDLRIEYETPDGRQTRVDLELATEHYRPGQMAQKSQAGFTVYGMSSSSGGSGAGVREDRELTQEILSI